MSKFNRRALLAGAAAFAIAVGSPQLAQATLQGTYPVFRVDGPGGYGGVGDAVGPITGSITTGTNILTRSGGLWTSADIGKLVLVNGAGGSASTPLTTTISGFTNGTTVTLAANATSTAAAQGVYYGTDNATAINSTWAAARALNGGMVLMGPGTFAFSQLALHNAIGITLVGTGRQSGAGPTDYGTHLWPLSTLSGGSGNAIDMSGSTYCGIRNMQIGRGDILQNINVGLLVCSKLGVESTEHIFEDILIAGNFARAAIYQFGVPNVTYRNIIAYTYANSALSFAASFTTSNVASVTSVNNTLNTGPIELTNVWMENCQLIEQGNPSGSSNSHGCLLDGVDSWTFINGLIGGSSALGLLQINDATANWGSRNVNIINTSMQGFGSAVPVYAINILSSVTIWGLKLAHLRFSDGSNAHNSNAQNPSTAMLQITPNPGTLINNLRIEGHPQLACALINGGGGTQVSGDGWYIEAGGCAINEPGSIVRSTYIKPGTVTPQAGATSARYGRVVEKAGSAAGNYTTASTSASDVDATNLAFTTVIPTGMALLVRARAAILNGTAGDGVMLIIADSTTSLEQQDITSPAGGQVLPCFLQKLITGDDASHTIKLRWNAITGGTATMRNAAANEAPKMEFEYVSI
jgi:hypothetical protein